VPVRLDRGEQAAVEGLGDGGGAVGNAELGVDVQQVRLDRGLADEQPSNCWCRSSFSAIVASSRLFAASSSVSARWFRATCWSCSHSSHMKLP
jgi:hypothetical protein